MGDGNLTLTTLTNVEDVVEDEKNKTAIYCIRCNSLILNPKVGTYLPDMQFEVPTMTQKKNSPSIQTETVKGCFRVDDMFHFENVGVSNQQDDVKYLACADCEFGPLGWCKNKTSFIALSRVRFQL